MKEYKTLIIFIQFPMTNQKSHLKKNWRNTDWNG